MICGSLGFQFKKLHFMMVKLSIVWLKIFKNYIIKTSLLIVGGSKRKPNRFGWNSLERTFVLDFVSAFYG